MPKCIVSLQGFTRLYKALQNLITLYKTTMDKLVSDLIRGMKDTDLCSFIDNLLNYTEDYQREPHWPVDKRLNTDAEIAFIVGKLSRKECKAVNISQARSKAEPYRRNPAIIIAEAVLNYYNLEPVIEKEQFKKIKNPKHETNPLYEKTASLFEFQRKRLGEDASVSKFDAYKGVYKGFFLRSSDGSTDEVAELAFIIRPDGSAEYHSKLNEGMNAKTFDFVDTNILKADFFSKDKKSCFNYVLNAKPDTDKTIVTDEKVRTYLDGIYGGYSHNSNSLPASGIIRLRKIADWSEKSEEEYRQCLLRSYDLDEPHDVEAILKEEPLILRFFMGMTDGFYTRLKIETIYSFMQARLIPRFEATAYKLEGYYIAMRLGTNRQNFFKRAVQIFEDGRVRLQLTTELNGSSTQLYTYWGRLHKSLDGEYTSISIDRIITTGDKIGKVNRSLYVYKTDSKSIDNIKKGSLLFGLAVIIGTDGEIRAGHEILQKVDKTTFDEINKNQGLNQKVKGSALKEQQDIDYFNYLRKLPILKVEPSPIINGYEDFKKSYIDDVPNYGLRCFESACLAAFKNDKLKMLDLLKEAVEHGFLDTEMFLKELDNGFLAKHERDLSNIFIYQDLSILTIKKYHTKLNLDSFDALYEKYKVDAQSSKKR
jgi:hypothetical protein